MKGVNINIAVVAVLGVGIYTSALADAAKDIVAVGPVEFVENGSVTVLGRIFKMQETSGLVAGEKIAVHGALQADGSASNTWAESMGIYAAGSDEIFQTGVVSKVDLDSGHISVGSSDVDYTATLGASNATIPQVGELVAVEGTQPNAGGVIIGSSTYAGLTAVNAAMAGSASKVAAVVASMSGGTKTAAIIGGGNKPTAIIGGGNKPTAIIGGGNKPTAIIGGGNKPSAIIGGGNKPTAIIGGGNKPAAIIGGGNKPAAIIGGGMKLTAIVGGV
jgi:hypothetical protein